MLEVLANLLKVKKPNKNITCIKEFTVVFLIILWGNLSSSIRVQWDVECHGKGCEYQCVFSFYKEFKSNLFQFYIMGYFVSTFEVIWSLSEGLLGKITIEKNCIHTFNRQFMFLCRKWQSWTSSQQSIRKRWGQMEKGVAHQCLLTAARHPASWSSSRCERSTRTGTWRWCTRQRQISPTTWTTWLLFGNSALD